MRVFNQRTPVVPVRNRLEGGYGVALYLGPPGVDDPARITYRNIRCLGQHPFIPIGTVWDPGGDYFIRETAVAVVKSPTTQISVALDATYTSVTFWCQIRTHQDSIENETIWRQIRVSVDASQDGDETIDGTALIIATQKLDGGGLRLKWLYLPATTGLQPVSFALTPTSGPTTPDDATATYQNGRLDYSVDVTGLTDAGAYGWNLNAINGSVTTTLTTVTFTADGSGPGAVQNLTAEEC